MCECVIDVKFRIYLIGNGFVNFSPIQRQISAPTLIGNESRKTLVPYQHFGFKSRMGRFVQLTEALSKVLDCKTYSTPFSLSTSSVFFSHHIAFGAKFSSNRCQAELLQLVQRKQRALRKKSYHKTLTFETLV